MRMAPSWLYYFHMGRRTWTQGLDWNKIAKMVARLFHAHIVFFSSLTILSWAPIPKKWYRENARDWPWKNAEWPWKPREKRESEKWSKPPEKLRKSQNSRKRHEYYKASRKKHEHLLKNRAKHRNAESKHKKRENHENCEKWQRTRNHTKTRKNHTKTR